MRYVLWMIAWVLSQRLMMMTGIVDFRSFFSTVLQSIISVICAMIIREGKVLLFITCALLGLWFVVCIMDGEIINALVGVSMNGILLAMALDGKRRRH